MNYATNKDAIIQIVTHDVGTPMTSFMSSATPLHARQRAALSLRCREGEGADEGGRLRQRLRDVDLLVLAGNQDEIGIATALQQMWGAIGIKLELQQVDNATRTEHYRDGDFTMRVSALDRRHRRSERDHLLLRLFPTIEALHSGWKNEEADKLFEASQKEIDADKRAEQYSEIQEIFNGGGPIIPLYETPYPVALQQEGEGLPADPARQQHLRRRASVEK